MNKFNLTIIIPIFNSSPFLRDSLAKLGSWSASRPDVEFIFVNDGSTDNSLSFINEFIRGNKNHKLIDYGINKGKGFAIRKGIESASGDFIAFTDSDLPYGLDIFDSMAEIMAADPQLMFLYGSRSHGDSQSAKYGFIRGLGRKFFSGVIRMMVLPDTPDTQCGIKMFRKIFAGIILKKSIINRFAFDVEIFVISNSNSFKSGIFPVKLLRNGESSINLVRDTLKMLADIFKINQRRKKGLYSI